MDFGVNHSGAGGRSYLRCPNQFRHAELVSAPIEPLARFWRRTRSGTVFLSHEAPEQSEKWALKQVQGDGKGLVRFICATPPPEGEDLI